MIKFLDNTGLSYLWGKITSLVSGKADKVNNAVSGNFASLDSNGNLTDSGHKHSDYLTSHQDISVKADKVSSPTSGNFASLDSNGNLVDSGYSASNFGEPGNSKVFYGTCSEASATKTVTCSDFSSSDLVDGVMIIVKFGATNTGAVASLTLNVNGTGAYPLKKIYSANGISNLTNVSEIAKNTVVPFIFNGSYWIVGGLDYNTNTTYALQSNYVNVGRVNVGAYPLVSNSLCAFDVNGNLMSFVTTATTSTGKTLVSSAFPIGSKIYMSGNALDANSSTSNVVLRSTATDLDLRYSSVYYNIAIFPNSTYNKVFMPVVVSESDNTFTLTTQSTSGYTNNFTNQRDLISGNFYVDIGFNSGARTSYYVYLQEENTLYYYDGSKLIDYPTYKNNSIGSGKADKVSNPTNGNFASLDSNGNLVDSGHSHSDYLTSHQDISNYVQKSNTSGLLKNDGTVDTNTYLTSHQDISGKANNISVNNHGTSDTTLTIAPNIFHIWGEVSTLTLTLDTPENNNIYNEYMFQFESGSTATNITNISGVSWIGGTPTIETNKTYQASIVNGIGVIGGV